jgi:hypothetical protein
MTFKRDPIKYIRDKAKSGYSKSTTCDVCGSTEDLDFHHFYSLTPLFDRWKRKNNIRLDTEEDLLEIRDTFIAEHRKELYDDAVTICNTLHQKLHSIYGKAPTLGTAKKQMRWIEKQKLKYETN